MINQTELTNLFFKLKQYPNWDREEQLAKNQRALELLRQMIQEHQNISDEEAKEREEFFEEFKQIVDNNRPKDCQLYSE